MYLRSIGSNGLKYTNKGMYTPPGGEGGCPAKLVYLREKSDIFSVLKDITFSQKRQLYLVYLTYLVYLRIVCSNPCFFMFETYRICGFQKISPPNGGDI